MAKKAVLLLTAVIGAAILAVGAGMFGAENKKSCYPDKREYLLTKGDLCYGRN